MLAAAIQNMTPEQQNQDVTVRQTDDEYFGQIEVLHCNDGVLDDGHPFLAHVEKD